MGGCFKGPGVRERNRACREQLSSLGEVPLLNPLFKAMYRTVSNNEIVYLGGRLYKVLF